MSRNSNIFFSQYTDKFDSKADESGSLIIEMNEFYLLNFVDSPILKSFREFPKDLTIITNSKVYYVFSFVYNDLCCSDNPPNEDNQITLEIDNEPIFSKLIDLINCEKVHLSRKDFSSFQKIINKLKFYSLYQFLEKIKQETPNDTATYSPSQFQEKLEIETSNDIIMNPLSLIDYMQIQPNNFWIITRKRSYQCNKIAAAVSEVIMNSIQKDNSIESYFYDFPDENDEFQIICDFLNFKPIQILHQNLNVLEKIASDLKFEMLLKIVTRINAMHCRCDEVLYKYQDDIDDVDDLFDVLKSKKVTDCVDFILQSKWLSNDQFLKELFGSLISLVFSSPKFIEKMAQIISILFEAIRKNQEEKNELNEINLRKIKKYLVKKITSAFPDSHVGPFVYELIRLNFFKLPINGLKSEDDDSDLLLQCVTNQYVALWILPELDSIVPNLQKFITSLENSSDHFRLSTTFMKPEYMKEDWKLLRTMREKKQSDNPIAIAIAIDDIDQFQKLIYTSPVSQDQNMGSVYFKNQINSIQKNQIEGCNSNVNNTIPVFEFDLYSGRFYVDYAAFYGAVKCFKYLILNGATVTSFTFDAAVEGGNIEIVHIVEQKLSEIGDDGYFNGKDTRQRFFKNHLSLDCSVFPRKYLSLINRWNGINRSIYKHNDDIFDWLFENKSINSKELFNMMILASLSNNVHVLSRILSCDPCFSSNDSNFLLNKCINIADSNGFQLFIRILIDYYGEENYKNLIMNYGMKNLCNYECDDIDLFKKICANEKDFLLFIYLLKSDSTNIFKYCYNTTDNVKLLEYFTKYSILNENDEIFMFLFDQIKTVIQLDQQEILVSKLLINSVKTKCFSILKYIIENKRNEIDISLAITKCLLISAKGGHEKIFDYLIQFLPDHDKPILNDMLIKNFILIVYSGNINIIKSVMKLINNEKYLKMIIFDALVDESNKLLNTENLTSRLLLSEKQGSLFSIPNVTEFLLSYVNDVISEFLLAATIVGNIEAVKAIVLRNSSYNFLNRIINPNGNALIIACRIQAIKIVKFLLNECTEIDPNIECCINKINYTPLMIAFKNQSIEIIQAIIEFYQSKNKNFQAEIESNNKSIQCTKEIQKALSMINENGVSNFSSEFEGILSALITIDGININEIYCNNSPFLYVIASDKLINLVNLALSLPNVDPNVCHCITKDTPLIKAIRTNQIKVAMSFLSHQNIDINFESIDHITALSESIDHITALSESITRNNLEIAKLLVQNKNLETNLNYSICLNSAILADSEEYVKLLLSRDECNVNEMIPQLNKSSMHRNVNDDPHDLVKNCIKMNFDILEKNCIPHSSSILQSAVKKGNINIVKSILNHPKFFFEKTSLTLALFESIINNNNFEIFELIRDQYLRLNDKDSDLLNLLDLNNNSLIVIASATNNIRFLESIPKIENKKSPVSISNYQLAFVAAPSTEMMELIIEKLPGVDLDLPLQNGSNYLTALIDFYYEKDEQIECNYYSETNKRNLFLKEQIVIKKAKFIISNSSLKLTTKDKNGCSFISKAASRIQCANFLQLTMLIYKSIKADDLIDEETKMNPLHFIACNLPIISLLNDNLVQNSKSRYNFDDSEDEFGFFVNQIIFNDKTATFLFKKYDEILKKQKSVFEDHLNSIDSLKQTPIIKAVLNLNLHFALFWLSNCSVDAEIVDIFGNTVLDYLLMISEILHANVYLTNENKIKDWKALINKKEETSIELCKLILKNLIESLSSFDCNLVCMIIIKLSTYLIASKNSKDIV